MTTDAHRCRVCGKLSEDDDDGIIRVGVRRWKHFRCLRLIGVDAILKPSASRSASRSIRRCSWHSICRRWRWASCPPATGRHARRQRRGARPFRTRVRPGDEQNRARQCRARLARRTRRLITMGPSASTSAKRHPSSAGARHDARPVSRTSRGAALRDASSRRPLSARPILSGATQSVRWAQYAPRLSLCSRSDLALSHARQRR
jgi:hypothetical protein